jgi:hypothetical protein
MLLSFTVNYLNRTVGGVGQKYASGVKVNVSVVKATSLVNWKGDCADMLQRIPTI